ncbi:hypothetical protein [Streptomyces sp. NPDC006333]|uniref:phosphotriesterase family protein n=1 Tax=Streptomyces sp. NPDC006333 TaxID=3156753 RepID=UPI0033B6A8B1
MGEGGDVPLVPGEGGRVRHACDSRLSSVVASSGRASQRRNTTSASRKGIGEPPCQGGGFARASVAGTGRAGRFEEELTPGVERVMRAVAQAHVRTGLPITVHTCAVARTGLVAQEILRREGVDLATVVIGHSGDTDDQDHLHRLIDNGSYVGTDRFGLDILLPGDRRVSGVAPPGRTTGKVADKRRSRRLSPRTGLRRAPERKTEQRRPQARAGGGGGTTEIRDENIGWRAGFIGNSNARDHRMEIRRKGRGNSENGVTGVVTPPSPF